MDNTIFHPDEWIMVRGVPIARAEIFLKQEQLGAQLFDESMFAEFHKKQACANIIRELDRKLKYVLVKMGLTKIPERDIIMIADIDPSWNYIPVDLFPPGSIAKVVPTKDSPAGKVAWFRFRKKYATM